MHGNTDGTGLVRDGTRDGLANPPGRVGREFITAPIFELVDRLHQADIAFLNQVQELQTAVRIFLGDRNHEAQVGLDHFLLRAARLGLADRYLAIDFLDFADQYVEQAFQVFQFVLPPLHLVLEFRERRRIAFLGLDVLVEPAVLVSFLGNVEMKSLRGMPACLMQRNMISFSSRRTSVTCWRRLSIS